MARKTLIQVRRDTAANWTSANPTLAAGEPAFETDTGKVKFGDGSTAWNSLGYIGTSAGVSSLAKNGSTALTGAVTLTGGTNVTLTQTGQDISIAATGGGTGPGTELGYNEITSAVNITSTSGAAPTVIIAGSSITFDGAPVLCELFTPSVNMPTTALSSTAFVGIVESGVYAGILGLLKSDQTANQDLRPFYGARRFTPSAGAHTYGFGAHVSATGGTPQIDAGAGTTTNKAPAFIRFTKI